MIGKTVAHYKIVGKIGEGGMGVVYRAQDTRDGRTVALKFLSPGLSSDTRAIRRLELEARTAASFDHPNICRVHEFGRVESRGWEGSEYEAQPFIAMEYLEGESLAARLGAGRLELGPLVDVAVQIAKALRAAHQRGFLHRDLKPSNVFITTDGIAKLLDFGLAKRSPTVEERDAATALTLSGSIVGTVDYMSPEQFLGQDLDARSDLYSLGAVLYEMATGRRPFPRDSLAATIDAVLHQGADPITAHDPEANPDLCRIVEKSLAKFPADRYQTADEVLVELQSISKAPPDRHPPGIRVVGIAGSLRDRSYTRRAVELALEGARQAGARTELIDLRRLRLPLCDGREDEDSYPADVAMLRATVRQAQGLILGTPEYHGSFSGVLKNALDLMGFEELEGKLVGLVGVSGGSMGAAGALTALRAVGRAVHAWVIPEQASVPQAWKSFDEEERLADPELRAKLESVGRQVARFAHLHASDQAREFLALWQDAPSNPGG